MSKEKIKKDPKIISETIFFFLIPIFGYFLTYAYEESYCMTHNIPSTFIEISLNTILRNSFFLLAISAVIYLIIEIFYSNLIEILPSKNPIVNRIAGILITNLIFFGYFFFFFVEEKTFSFREFLVPIIIVQIILIFFVFIYPILETKNVKGFRNRLRHSLKKSIFSNGVSNDSIIGKGLNIIGPSVSNVIIIFFALFVIAFSVGRFEAKYKTMFLIIKSNPELIILRKYSDNFVCSTFDREKKEINCKFYLISIDQIIKEGLQITEEKIGSLSVSNK